MTRKYIEMKELTEQRAGEIALQIVLNHYRREELFTRDCPELIRGIAKVAGLDAKTVRDFFSICVIPIAMRASFGWISTTTHCDGTPPDKSTQERIALAALIHHMRTNGFRINPRMRRDLQNRAQETGTNYEELQALFTDYLIPEAIKTALKIKTWEMEVHEEIATSQRPETQSTWCDASGAPFETRRADS